MNWEKVKDVLTFCLIPAMGWVMMTSNSLTSLQQVQAQQAKEIAEIQGAVKGLQKRTISIELQNAKIETKLDHIIKMLEKVK
jgi:hypothetical protein